MSFIISQIKIRFSELTLAYSKRLNLVSDRHFSEKQAKTYWLYSCHNCLRKERANRVQLFFLIPPTIRRGNRSPRELWKPVSILWPSIFVCEVNHQTLPFSLMSWSMRVVVASKICQLQYPHDFIVCLSSFKDLVQKPFLITY